MSKRDGYRRTLRSRQNLAGQRLARMDAEWVAA